MKRDFEAFCREAYDIVVIGGGIYGIACAREAAFRGYKVGLIEKSDFGSAASANSAKIAHCGMRYLQHLDFARMRESIRERNNMHQLAPHLVESQRFLMPAYGHGIKGRETMSIYVKAYDWLSPERKQFEDPYRKVPDSRSLSPDEVKEIFPDVDTNGLTGGITWYEGQMQNTERLSLAMLQSACDYGAACLNYARVESINTEDKQISSVTVKDEESGIKADVRTTHVINAAGPWAMNLLNLVDEPIKDIGIHNSKAFSLLTRAITDDTAITFSIRPMYVDKKAVLNKKSSMQFAIPWRDKTMFASLHLPCGDTPEDVVITEEEINEYITRINEGYPNLNMTTDDVEHILWGIIPAESKDSAAPLKQFKLFDHAKLDGIQGLSTVIGVKYTTARDVAEKHFDKLNLNGSNVTKTSKVPFKGGDIEYFEEYVESSISKYQDLPSEAVVKLIKTYGTEFEKVIELARSSIELSQFIPGTKVLAAQVVYAIREEMAVHFSDVVLRRLDIGSHEIPAKDALGYIVRIMAGELGWTDDVCSNEVKSLMDTYLIRAAISVDSIEDSLGG